MADILLINPNTSSRTTETMLAAARPFLPAGAGLRSATAARGAGMILDEDALAAAAGEVLRMGREDAAGCVAVIVSAFGDPGLAALRRALAVPVVGICEAALREASAGGRRFGIATTTPGLVRSIENSVLALGLEGSCSGLRVPDGDPLAYAADSARQDAALAEAVEACMARDGAERVVIGGGPLSASATRLRDRYGAVIVEPVPAAMRAVARSLAPDGTAAP